MQDLVRPTTIIRSAKLLKYLDLDITIASETFQTTGSFKFRAAYNLASQVKEEMLITASSGNFGQALAFACQLLGKSCIVVMPENSVQVKIDAVRNFGAKVELVDTKKISRTERLNQLAKENPSAFVASAYDHPLIIEGNATLGYELSQITPAPDIVVAPIGGGGLISGIIKGFRQNSNKMPQIIGAEPLLGNDAAKSLTQGNIVSNDEEPQTIADGARTLSIGKYNWEYIKNSVSKIIEVPEEKILKALWLLFSLANLKCEPTGALSLAAILTTPDIFTHKKTVAVVSGGNVDTLAYCKLLEQAMT